VRDLKPTWFFSFEPLPRRLSNGHTRSSEKFSDEQSAKAFARDRLNDALHVIAGTLNPHLPKRVIGSAQIVGWLNENRPEAG